MSAIGPVKKSKNASVAGAGSFRGWLSGCQHGTAILDRRAFFFSPWQALTPPVQRKRAGPVPSSIPSARANVPGHRQPRRQEGAARVGQHLPKGL
jgi:hypothetical protein